jgi:hypothetical protein
MAIDPDKIITIGSGVIDSIDFIKKTVALFPKGKPHKARRKSDWDPQRVKDRRKSGVNLRLKTGIWFKFHFKTGYGKFQVLEASDPANLINAFIVEGENYEFSDRNSPDTLLMPATIADPAAEFACRKWLEHPHDKRYASVLTEEFGDYILSNYNVRMIDLRRLPKTESPLNSVGQLLEKARALFGEGTNKKRRKEDWDSRPGKDRRILGVGERLRTGIWLQFHRKTGYGMEEFLEAPQSRSLMDAFITEGERYEFSDRSSDDSVTPAMIANAAASFARTKWMEFPAEQRLACILTDEVANYVLSHYNVRMVDRRRVHKHRAMAG